MLLTWLASYRRLEIEALLAESCIYIYKYIFGFCLKIPTYENTDICVPKTSKQTGCPAIFKWFQFKPCLNK